MYRKMRRYRQEIANRECCEILKTEKRGALSVINENGFPYVIPMDFYYDEEYHKLYFHGAKEGQKIDALRVCDKVCFTTWNKGTKLDNDWSYYVTSVVVFGKAKLITDAELTSKWVRQLACKYFPSEEEIEEVMQRSISKTQLIEVSIEHMTGKLVHEK